MKTPLTFYCYHVPLSKRLADILSLFCLRIGLFFFVTSFRYSGMSMAIALLLFLTGTSCEPLNLEQSGLQAALVLVPRVFSILLSIMWMSLTFARLSMQWTRATTWKQEMQQNEECLRYRISVLEDWLVPPTHTPSKACGEVIQVRYK